jgi:20S proteasome alpha/beta subunit
MALDAQGKAEAPHTGTTIVAVTFDGGVVLGADGRVSTGTYISNRASNKIQQLTDSIYLLRSGSAADTQAIGDYGAPLPTGPAQRVRAPARRVCAASVCMHEHKRSIASAAVLVACTVSTCLI